jgi:predicted transcriptional regulator
MGAPKLRAEVEKIIKKADDRLLEMMYAMATAYTNKNIVAYSTDGKALTREDYIQQIEAAEADIEAGKTITTVELKKRMKSWKKT